MPFTRSQRQGYRHVAQSQLRYFADKIYDKYRYKQRHDLYLQYKKSLRVDDVSAQENKMGEDQPQGFKVQNLNINSGNRPLKRMLKGKIHYRDTFHSSNTWGTGTTHYALGPCIGTRDQWLYSTASTTTNRTENSYRALFDLNPLQGISTGAIVPSNSAPPMDMMGISAGTLHFDFVNKSTLPCVVKVHFFVAKDDTSDNILADHDSGLIAQTLYSTDYTFGLTGALPIQQGNEPVDYYPQTTTQPSNMTALAYSGIFRTRIARGEWKKLKTATFVLSSADTQRLNVYLTLNQLGIKEKLSDETPDYPKGCVISVIEYQGVAGKLVASNNLTYGGGDVGYCCTRKLNLAVLKAPNARFNTSYVGLGTIVQGGAIGTTEQYTEVITEQVGTALS